MKICTKCGAEAFDNAVLCAECGGFVGSKNKLQPEQQTNPPVQKQQQAKSIPITAQPTAIPQAQNIEPVQSVQKPEPVVQQPIQQQQMNVHRKFCSMCGAEVLNNASVCLKCGCLVGNVPKNPVPQPQYQQSGFQQAQSYPPQQYSQQASGNPRQQYSQQVPNYSQQQQYSWQAPSVQQPSYQTYGYAKKESGVPSILNCIASILTAASIFLWLIGMLDSYISIKSYGISLYYGDQIIAGFICALAAFAMGVTSLIVALAQRAKKESVLGAIERIIFGIALALPALVSGIF